MEAAGAKKGDSKDPGLITQSWRGLGPTGTLCTGHWAPAVKELSVSGLSLSRAVLEDKDTAHLYP